MLKEIAPRPEETPNTPMSEDFRRLTNGPAADYHRFGAARLASGPTDGVANAKIKRKIHSAPIKKMGGIFRLLVYYLF